jgi:hypothetical protein
MTWFAALMVVVLVLLDLSSAFEMEHHDILTVLAHHFSVSETALDWFSSYLAE